MESKKYDYYAFISYKREDEKWAKWLQRKLESYGFPVSLRRDNPALPSKIRPVFRDQSELSGGNLKEEIEKGLRTSKYLIVICSPRSARSPWVSKEVQYFIDNEKEDHIIPFIIGGTPNAANLEDECFPEGLRQLSGEKEILGININEMGREAAAIKVIACMFNLRFDSLWQRHVRANRSKRIVIFGGVFVFAIVGFVLAGIMTSLRKEAECQRLKAEEQTKIAQRESQRANKERDRANDQSKLAKIERDNALNAYRSLKIANENIKVQSSLIGQQNKQLQVYINTLKEDNKTISQMKDDKGMYSYAGSIQGNDGGLVALDFHPYEPIVAFSDAWGTWLHYINSNKEILMPFKGDEYETVSIEGVAFSDDGTELIMSSLGGTYVWNIYDHKLINYISRDDDAMRDSLISKRFPNYNQISNLQNLDHLSTLNKYNAQYNGNSLTVSMSNKSNSTNLRATKYNPIIAMCNPQFKEVLFLGDKRAALFDEERNEFVQFFKGYECNTIEYSCNGEYLLIDNDIFTRKSAKTDTIKITSYSISAFLKEDSSTACNKSNILKNVTVNENLIEYDYNGIKKNILVLRPFTSGNGQEYLSHALVCNTHKIVGIVEQGDHRVYNASTGELIGRLDNYVWDENPMGYESCLGHWNSYIIQTVNIDRTLFVVSSGGVVRVYNIDKLTLDKVIELPLYKCAPPNVPQCHIDTCMLSKDGKLIQFRFADYDTVYECSLQ